MSRQTNDPVDQLVDELTALRRSVENLARTSLNKDEAQDLHRVLAESVDRMFKVGPQVQTAIDQRLVATATSIKAEAVRAAQSAAQSAIRDSSSEVLRVARGLSAAAGEARAMAWRYFGGFWVWLASMLTTGALLGALAAFWITGRGDAQEFGRFPRVYCGDAGGQIVEQKDGSSFCAVWIDPPKSGN